MFRWISSTVKSTMTATFPDASIDEGGFEYASNPSKIWVPNGVGTPHHLHIAGNRSSGDPSRALTQIAMAAVLSSVWTVTVLDPAREHSWMQNLPRCDYHDRLDFIEGFVDLLGEYSSTEHRDSLVMIPDYSQLKGSFPSDLKSHIVSHHSAPHVVLGLGAPASPHDDWYLAQ